MLVCNYTLQTSQWVGRIFFYYHYKLELKKKLDKKNEKKILLKSLKKFWVGNCLMSQPVNEYQHFSRDGLIGVV